MTASRIEVLIVFALIAGVSAGLAAVFLLKPVLLIVAGFAGFAALALKIRQPDKGSIASTAEG